MNHLAQIAARLTEYELDAMLITSQPGELYALGFHGEGLVLVSREGTHYSTDGRYIEAARQQIVGAEICLVSREKGHLTLAAEYIQTHGLEKVGFESGNMSVDTYHSYAEKLPCLLVPAQSLLDELRKDLCDAGLNHGTLGRVTGGEGLARPGQRCLLLGNGNEGEYAFLCLLDVDSLGRIRSLNITNDARYEFETI